jgi:DNA-binding CsgD family transcriptional regulator
VALGGSLEWRASWRSDWWEHVILGMAPALLAELVSFSPVAYGSQIADGLSRRAATFEEYLESLSAAGFAEAFGRALPAPPPDARRRVAYVEGLAVTAADPSGHVVLIGANRDTVARSPPEPELVQRWSRVAAHLGAAHRLRRRLRGQPPLDGAEAVISPAGKVLHAEGAALAGDARELLRTAALAVDRARTAQVRETDEALSLWRALHAARWTLADAFDADGRRFLVARENAPATDPDPALSRREQQVLDLLALGRSNRMIAYELGISASSVATHIRRAAQKVGLGSARELVRWARARRRPPEA